MRGGEDELSGEGESRRVPGHMAAEVKLAGHGADRVVSWAGGNLKEEEIV